MSFPLLGWLPEEPITVRSKVAELGLQSPPTQSTSLWACPARRSSGRSRTRKRAMSLLERALTNLRISVIARRVQ